jgi:hypothetical protein
MSLQDIRIREGELARFLLKPISKPAPNPHHQI